MYKCSYYKYIARTVTGIVATLAVFSRQHAAHGHNNILKSTAIITTIATTTATTTAYLLKISTSTLHFYIFYHSPLLQFVASFCTPRYVAPVKLSIWTVYIVNKCRHNINIFHIFDR